MSFYLKKTNGFINLKTDIINRQYIFRFGLHRTSSCFFFFFFFFLNCLDLAIT
jgi:hypothetical protein